MVRIISIVIMYIISLMGFPVDNTIKNGDSRITIEINKLVSNASLIFEIKTER